MAVTWIDRTSARWTPCEIPLLGGPFDCERWVAMRPPPATLRLSEHNGQRSRYLLHALAGGRLPLRAYVLDSLGWFGTAAACVRALRPARILPEPWQSGAPMFARSPRVICPGCGRRADRYAAQSQLHPSRMVLRCLDCGRLHASLIALP